MNLHLVSLAPAAVGLCCLAADRRRARALELSAAVIMMAAMADTAIGQVVSPVWWCAVLLLTAIVLGAVRGRARGSVGMPMAAAPGRAVTAVAGAGGGFGGAAMAAHAASGLVVMAALLLAMTGTGGAGAPAGHHHGTGVVGLGVVAAVLAAAYVAGSIAVAMRSPSRLDRAQYGAMAASVALMALEPLLA